VALKRHASRIVPLCGTDAGLGITARWLGT